MPVLLTTSNSASGIFHPTHRLNYMRKLYKKISGMVTQAQIEKGNMESE